MIEKPFDANKLYNQIVHYYIDKKGLAKEQANDIADIIEFVVNRPSHVNIADILVLPQAQATSSIIDKK